MSAGKSPNNVFNLHKEMMRPIFTILGGNHGQIIIKYKDIIKPFIMRKQKEIGPNEVWMWRHPSGMKYGPPRSQPYHLLVLS